MSLNIANPETIHMSGVKCTAQDGDCKIAPEGVTQYGALYGNCIHCSRMQRIEGRVAAWDALEANTGRTRGNTRS